MFRLFGLTIGLVALSTGVAFAADEVPRYVAQRPDHRFAVIAGYRNDLVQQTPPLSPRQGAIALSLGCQVLPNTRSGHGYLPPFGNRTSATYPLSRVTIILMRRARLTVATAGA